MSFDDFELILGVDFLTVVKAVVMLRLGGMLIMEESHLLFVARLQRKKKGNGALFLAMQLEQGLKRGELTYMEALLALKPNKVMEILDEVAGILSEFKDVMPLELPKWLPPRWAINHQVEFILRVKPPSKAPYRMSQLELQELMRQLTELSDTGYVQPSKALMVLLSFSKRSKMIPCSFVLIIGL